MIDKSKTYKTRDGHEVRIYATDGGASYPVHGAILINSFWSATNWARNGLFKGECGEQSCCDLIEVRPRHKRTVWLNVYENGEYAWPRKDMADKVIDSADRIACIKVELDFEEGEGL
jgi:hypothetical protein